MKVTVVDYGVGNLLSVQRALEACGGATVMATTAEEVLRAERLVLPGVGAFHACIDALRRRRLLDSLLSFAETKRPLLGICVGMQMLLDYGTEFGEHEGLRLIPGHVAAVPANGSDGQPHKIPHIGWSRLIRPAEAPSWQHGILADLPDEPEVYFVHSFAANPDDPQQRLADCDYHGRKICAVVGRDNIHGCQFHPEKSGPVGLKILSRFLAL